MNKINSSYYELKWYFSAHQLNTRLFVCCVYVCVCVSMRNGAVETDTNDEKKGEKHNKSNIFAIRQYHKMSYLYCARVRIYSSFVSLLCAWEEWWKFHSQPNRMQIRVFYNYLYMRVRHEGNDAFYWCSTKPFCIEYNPDWVVVQPTKRIQEKNRKIYDCIWNVQSDPVQIVIDPCLMWTLLITWYKYYMRMVV